MTASKGVKREGRRAGVGNFKKGSSEVGRKYTLPAAFRPAQLPKIGKATKPVGSGMPMHGKAHGFGHEGSQRDGPLRLSGDRRAHRVGMRDRDGD